MRSLYSLEKNQSENYDIEVYTDSVKIIREIIGGKRYDLIFLDIMMPEKSGVEVGKIIRNDKNEYLLIENSNYILGVLHINKRGFGFVIIDEESDDIFISSRDLKDAFNMDTVMVDLKSIKQDRVKKVELLKLLKEDKQDLLGC